MCLHKGSYLSFPLFRFFTIILRFKAAIIFLELYFPFAAALPAEALMESIYDNSNVQLISH